MSTIRSGAANGCKGTTGTGLRIEIKRQLNYNGAVQTWRRFPECLSCTSSWRMPMSTRMRFSSFVIFTTVACVTTLAQDHQPEFKARELFYNPIVPARPAAKQDVPTTHEATTKADVPVK